jgi:hypothetical protein
MPANVKTTASWADVEILKFPTGLHQIKSVVLDGSDFPVSTPNGARYVVPAGTILTVSVTNTDKYVAYKGTGKIKGVLGRPVDMLAQSTANSEPAPMFFNGAIFATTAIVGFTQYASALVADLPHCDFQ